VARVRSLEPGHQTIRPHTSEADCFFQIIDEGQGVRLLHLTTFGSDSRVREPKSSQSLQLDEDMAGQVVSLMLTTFPRLADRL
jgi:5-methylcytosine-specific restriction protein B